MRSKGGGTDLVPKILAWHSSTNSQRSRPPPFGYAEEWGTQAALRGLTVVKLPELDRIELDMLSEKEDYRPVDCSGDDDDQQACRPAA